jgi:hypothetical protein
MVSGYLCISAKANKSSVLLVHLAIWVVLLCNRYWFLFSQVKHSITYTRNLKIASIVNKIGENAMSDSKCKYEQLRITLEQTENVKSYFVKNFTEGFSNYIGCPEDCIKLTIMG